MNGPAILATDVGRRFVGRWALRGIDLSIPDGVTVLLHGANGSGKTTLLRVLASALSATTGAVHIFGKPAIEARADVALLSHADGHYDELSGWDNLDLAVRLGSGRGDVAATLARVGLASRGRDAVRGYSAGMRKRLAFARVLLKAPKVAMFDEPYAALDPAGHDFVDGLFAELKAAGSTVLVSTHQVARVAAFSDLVVRLHEGRVATAEIEGGAGALQ